MADREEELKERAVWWFEETHRTYVPGRESPHLYCVLDTEEIAILTDRKSGIICPGEFPDVSVRVYLPYNVIGGRHVEEKFCNYVERE